MCAVFSLAVFLPYAPRNHSYRGVSLVVREECEAKCRGGAESEADDERKNSDEWRVTSDE